LNAEGNKRLPTAEQKNLFKKINSYEAIRPSKLAQSVRVNTSAPTQNPTSGSELEIGRPYD